MMYGSRLSKRRVQNEKIKMGRLKMYLTECVNPLNMFLIRFFCPLQSLFRKQIMFKYLKTIQRNNNLPW